MSVAVALSKQGQIALATDSQTSFGAERVPPENKSEVKYMKVGAAYIASTGWTLYSNILRDVLRRRKGVPRLDDEDRIFTFFNELWHVLHKRYSFVNDQADEGDSGPFGSLDSSFMVVGSRGIFSVSSDLSVTRFERYFAIGSGAQVALGAMHARYAGDETAGDIVGAAVEAAIAHDIYCGLPVNSVVMKASNARRSAAS